MSHTLREQTDCLNCGHTVESRYCTACGQENLVPRESFGHIMSHFLTDYLHLDKKFFSGIIPLLFKPGFLTNEFNAGRRARHVHPFRLYIFISIMYFLATGLLHHHVGVPLEQHSAKEIATEKTNDADSDKTPGFPKDKITYLAQQASLPEAVRDGPLLQFVFEKILSIRESGYSISQKIDEGLLKNAPKVAFLLLPVLALLLKLMFRKERLFYVEHFYHAVYLQSFTFVLLGVMLLLDKVPSEDFVKSVGLLLLLIPVHLYFSCRRVYQESRAATVAKIVFTIGGYLFFLLLFTLLGLFYSVVTI